MKKTSASSTFSAELSSLRPILSWIRNQVEQCHFSTTEIRHIEIALEEALVNIIHYAYPSEKGVVEITYHFFPGHHFELIIKDYGKPFNPIANSQKVDRTASLEERKEGGLGISFIQELMDEMEYVRDANANILTLRKCKNKNRLKRIEKSTEN